MLGGGGDENSAVLGVGEHLKNTGEMDMVGDLNDKHSSTNQTVGIGGLGDEVMSVGKTAASQDLRELHSLECTDAVNYDDGFMLQEVSVSVGSSASRSHL